VTQRSDKRSTTKIAVSPTEVAAVMTMTWRIVEPSVKTARGFDSEVNGGLVLASRSFIHASHVGGRSCAALAQRKMLRLPLNRGETGSG
jgi:hypothetical protein